MDLQTMADSDFPHGRRYYTKSGYFHLPRATARLIVWWKRLRPSPHRKPRSNSPISAGRGRRIAADETAFGDRSAPFIMNLLGELVGSLRRCRQYFLDSRDLQQTSAGNETGSVREFHERRRAGSRA